MNELLNILVVSVRDGYIQVSVFVAITVLIFSYIQYKTHGALLDGLHDHEELQPLFGALMGLTPGCGGAIVMMPLYVRGTISFGTVVATLAATAGDSAFVILAMAPKAALYIYSMAFVAAVAFGYAIDHYGLGVGWIDAAISRWRDSDGAGTMKELLGMSSNPAHEYEGNAPGHTHEAGPDRSSAILTPLSHIVHWLWWLAALVGLYLGVSYLLQGGPEVAVVTNFSFSGLFTIVGITGTTLSFYLYFVGRHYIGEGHVGKARESFASIRDTLQHAAMETSFVTVWVLGAYLVYEYPVALFNLDIGSIAASAGVLAPIGGAAIGLIPGCGPQIVLAGAYTRGAVPISALAANAISQDGDALFPLLAVDKKAALLATIYTTIPALIVGLALYYLWEPILGLASFGFGTL